ncbi:MAG: dihydrofolate reductase family protein [Pyrinomonadaceae bacterium]
MSTIVVQAFITLDGVVQAGGGPDEDREGGFEHGGWMMKYDEQMDKLDEGGKIVTEWESRTEALLLGRKTYRDLGPRLGRVGRERRGPAGGADQEVQPRPQVRCVAHADRGRLEELAPAGPRRALGGGETAGGAGRRDPRVGSTQLIRTLAEHDLIDEYRLAVYPLVLGTGKKLFSDGFALARLTLVETRALRSGVLVNAYRRSPSKTS